MGSRASVGRGGLPRGGDTDAVPRTEQNLPKERRREGMQAVRMVHLIKIIIAESVISRLQAQCLNQPIFITANKEVIRSQAKLRIL